MKPRLNLFLAAGLSWLLLSRCTTAPDHVFEVETVTGGKIDQQPNNTGPLKVYVDRNYYFKDNLPLFDSLNKHCTYIRLHNADKNNTAAAYLRITSSQPLDIFLLMDERVARGRFRPAWLNGKGWDSAREKISTDRELKTTYQVFIKRNVKTFPFILGGNKRVMDPSNSSSMYELFIGLNNDEQKVEDDIHNPLIRISNAADNSDSVAIMTAIARHSAWLNNKDSTGRLGDDSNDLSPILARTRFNLSDADLKKSDLSRTGIFADTLAFCNFAQALLSNTNFGHSDISGCNLRGTQLNSANFDSAQLISCDLTASDLSGAWLRTTKMNNCDLSRAVFEPDNLPKVEFLMTCQGLDKLTFRDNPAKGYELAEKFRQAGLKKQYLDVIYALNVYKTEQTGSFYRFLRTLLFEDTCEYGRAPFKLLRLFLNFFILYFLLYIGAFAWVERRRRPAPGLYYLAHKGIIMCFKAVFANKFMEELKLNTLSSPEETAEKEKIPPLLRILFITQALLSFYFLALFLSILLKNPFENFIL